MTEAVAEFAVAAAAAAAGGGAAAANGVIHGGGGGSAISAPYLSEYSEEAFSSTQALVSYLRMEADLAEEKAKRLRDQAAALAIQFSVSETLQQQYGACPSEMIFSLDPIPRGMRCVCLPVSVWRNLIRRRSFDIFFGRLTLFFVLTFLKNPNKTKITNKLKELPPDQLPPLDANGVPKYKGKKRGRKPKYRKRKANPNRRKRQHTAYTLYVQETYPGIKAANPELPSKDVISIVAKQWADGVSVEEKRQWKERAKATHGEDEDNADGTKLPSGPGGVAVAAAAGAGASSLVVGGGGELVVGTDDEEDDDDEDDVVVYAEEDDDAAAAAAAAAAEVDVVEHDDVAGTATKAEPMEDDSPAPPARRSKRAKKG